MKVGIDSFGCDGGRSGRGSYLASLVGALPESPLVSWELFGPEMDRYTYTAEKGLPFASVHLPDSLNMERLWHIAGLGSFCRKQGYDAVIYAAGPRLLPASYRRPGIVVVNDVLSTILREEESALYRKLILASLSKAACVIAGSDYIRQDMAGCRARIRRIEVVHSGIDHANFTPIGKSESDVIDIKPFAIKKPYLIYPSRMQGESKKHVELIRAFSLFKERTHLPHRLVIAGSEGRYSDSIRNAALSSPFASDIFLTGYFPHEHFGDLYRNADACVFPAVGEGVGLPVMEAMACGLPVACSGSGALKEIAGDSALYFDSDSSEAIASCLEQIVADIALRQRLSSGGLKKAEEYSWKKTAERTLEIVSSVCG